jgi:uncharacterized cupin superfamily protein
MAICKAVGARSFGIGLGGLTPGRNSVEMKEHVDDWILISRW